MRTWERIIRGLGLTVILVFFVIIATPAANIVSRRMAVTGPVQSADAIVVLGAGLINRDVMVEESLRRVVHGVELYKEGLAPVLVVLGPPLRPGGLTEAAVRATFARGMGVPDAAILKIENADTTREESAETAKLLRQRGLHRILLVTESLHMRRARLVFERAGLEVLAATSNHYPDNLYAPTGRMWLAMRVAQETMALLYYRVAGYI